MIKETSAVFIGHRQCPEITVENLTPHIEAMIAEGVNTFYNGGMGAFDLTAAQAVFNLKWKYPHIKSYLVIPYHNFRIVGRELFDDVIYPFEGRESTFYYRAAIPKRNCYMVDNSAFALCYVSGAPGGATTTYNYAEKMGLKVKNIFFN